jgi:hypothetical protein
MDMAASRRLRYWLKLLESMVSNIPQVQNIDICSVQSGSSRQRKLWITAPNQAKPELNRQENYPRKREHRTTSNINLHCWTPRTRARRFIRKSLPQFNGADRKKAKILGQCHQKKEAESICRAPAHVKNLNVMKNHSNN